MVNIGDIYKGVNNNVLLKIIDIQTINNSEYVYVEDLNAKENKKNIFSTILKNFERLELIKVEQWVILNLKMLVN